MAKFSPGAAVGAISGAQGGIVFSHNRYGVYFRTRAIPTNPNTGYQQQVRGDLAACSQAWGALTAAQQEAWRNWAQVNPITDALGQQQVTTGHIAFVRCNQVLRQSSDTAIDVPPTSGAPAALTSLSLTADIGAGDVALTTAPTPLGADLRLWVRAAVLTNPGRRYVSNLYKLVTCSAKAQATGLDIEADVIARFGTLQVGQILVVSVQTMDSTTGLLSAPMTAIAAVTTT